MMRGISSIYYNYATAMTALVRGYTRLWRGLWLERNRIFSCSG